MKESRREGWARSGRRVVFRRLFLCGAGAGLALVLALSGCSHPKPAAAPPGDPNKPKTDAVAGDSFLAGPSDSHDVSFGTGRRIPAEEVPLLEQIDQENAKVVSSALASIVRITAMGPADPHAALFGNLPFKLPFGHPLPPATRQTVPSYGSGVVITQDGYIVTNAHVLEGAESVEVQLRDGRTFPARIVASDTPLDVSIVKIKAGDLPVLPWGNSDKVQVGQQVFAIGNPFGLDDSVTRGIVSAKGRFLPDSSYEDYIQTDAPINVGNSGGALVNIHGELIGINAAIASFTRGSEGVGFSIPSNLVHYAVETLLKEGRIVRGYLGVRLPAKIDGGVVEQLGLDSSHGALLAGIQRSSPADQAKLQSVDFITEVDGQKIDGVTTLRLIVAQLPVGKQVVIDYIRGGALRSTTVKIGELPKEAETEFPAEQVMSTPGLDASTSTLSANAMPGNSALSGLEVTDLNDTTRHKYGVDDMVTSGVVVSGVKEGSPADQKGLVAGDVIEIASSQHASIQLLVKPGDFADLTKKLKPDQGVVLLVHHGKTSGQEDRSSIFMFLGPLPK